MTTYNTGSPLGSAAAKDLYDNAENFDHLSNDKINELWKDRIGVDRLTWYGMEKRYQDKLSSMGWTLIDSFQDGAELTRSDQALHWKLPDGDGEYYRWAGVLPKTVPVGSTPQSTGGVGPGAWLSIGDAALRSSLASSSGAGLIGTSNGMTVQQIIERGTIYIDDLPGVTTDGSADCAAAINDLLNQIRTISGRRWVVRILGTRGATYRLDSTIDLTNIESVEFKLCLSTLLDNVQGFITSTGRANPTVLIYNSKNIKFGEFNYSVSDTRADSYSINTISPALFWCGGQYMGNETTRDIDIHNVYSKNNSVPHGFVVAGMGELDGVSLRRFYIDGGSWRFGCNFEWGSAPVDPSIDGTLNNGKHPYNIHVEEFHGFNLYECEGFLRTASAYNCKFLNCSGYNVKSFIYCYSGDKGIARYSQNISFENCISKVDSSTFTMANNAITISIIDTLNGTALPSWTNYDQLFEFINCQVLNNLTPSSSSVRFIGNKGKTKFQNCIFWNSYYGVNSQRNSETSYNSENSLHFSECVFKGNVIDARLLDSTEITFDKCTFKEQSSSATTPPLSIGAGANRTKFYACSFLSLPASRAFVNISGAFDCVFNDNNFTLFSSSDSAIISTANRFYGLRNVCNGLITPAALSYYRALGDETSGVKSLDDLTTSIIDYYTANVLTSSATNTVSRITGGVVGNTILFRGISSASSVTFKNAATGVAVTERLVLKTGADATLTGNSWSKTFMKLSSGWFEM